LNASARRDADRSRAQDTDDFHLGRKEVPVNTSIVATLVGVALVAAATFSAAAQAPQPNQYVQLQRSTAQLVAQLDMAAAPTLDTADIRSVQQALHDKGFDPGPIDGIVGSKTQEAVRSFQDRYGIAASGGLDNQTLYALGKPDLAKR
jgi:peptidoglycan hydrolase-like protein with peptidoglycan-binding domain